MRQALTAKGQLDAWMRSSEAALANMGVEDIMVDENSLHIEGKHPEHGPIGIDYMIPEMGKTRMVIQVDDPKMITAFKRAVTPVFKNVIKELEKLEEEQMQQAEAKINADQPDESDNQVQEPESQEAESQETDKIDYKPELSEEAGTEKAAEAAQPATETGEEGAGIAEAADKPVKKKKKGPMIALIVIAIVVVAAAASYFLYFRDHGLPFTKNSSSTTSSSSKSSNKSSSSNSSSSTSSNSQASTDNSNSTNNNSSTTSTNTTTAGTITKAQYDQITNGMTYDQVKQIIGSDGSKLSESTYKDAQGNTVNVQIFYWQGNGSSDSNANITFQGNTVASKSSYGLK